MNLLWIAFWIFAGFIGALHLYHHYLVWSSWSQSLKDANKKARHAAGAVKELMSFISEYRAVSPSLEDVVREMKDSFLKESIEIYLSGALRGYEYLKALRNRQHYDFKREEQAQEQWAWISRVTPAVAWVVALGSVMYVWDKGLGPQTSLVVGKIVLGTVFYCIAFNFVFVEPLRRWQARKAEKDREKNEALVLGLSLLLRDRDSLEILEAVNAYLAQSEKVEWDEAFGTRRKYLEEVA
ncbi:MAG: hypothetical protein H6624_08695 [Bdellovibrionaceae bacterium]|nr:hypothetical protein [Bdellovibrionales bacterium]MCB9084410.1 hypothetical protein [Pseudobdellovibrionaceae bacterium]